MQLSVFEGEVTPRGLSRLQQIVASRIEPTEDVRIYVLCGGCRGSTLLLGRARRVPDPREPLVDQVVDIAAGPDRSGRGR